MLRLVSQPPGKQAHGVLKTNTTKVDQISKLFGCYQTGSQLIKVCRTNSSLKGYAIVRNMNLLSTFSVLELDKVCKHGKPKASWPVNDLWPTQRGKTLDKHACKLGYAILYKDSYTHISLLDLCLYINVTHTFFWRPTNELGIRRILWKVYCIAWLS